MRVERKEREGEREGKEKEGREREEEGRGREGGRENGEEGGKNREGWCGNTTQHVYLRLVLKMHIPDILVAEHCGERQQ